MKFDTFFTTFASSYEIEFSFSKYPKWRPIGAKFHEFSINLVHSGFFDGYNYKLEFIFLNRKWWIKKWQTKVVKLIKCFCEISYPGFFLDR